MLLTYELFSRNGPCKIDGSDRRMCNRKFSYEIFFLYIHVTTILLLYTSILYTLYVDVLVQSTNCNSKLDDIWKLCITFPFLLYIECLTAWKYYKLSHLLLVGCFCTLYTYISWKCFSQINHYERPLYRLIIAYDIFAEIDYFNHTKRYLSYQFTLPVLFIHYIDDKHDSEKFFRR